ncbi:hypothetical protein [Chlamydia vaughanii]|uniref:hypothetical protein n=1 Tax=Chlamydia vaughanii TaxID=3112552 RepID=UPI0032B12067
MTNAIVTVSRNTITGTAPQHIKKSPSTTLTFFEVASIVLSIVFIVAGALGAVGDASIWLFSLGAALGFLAIVLMLVGTIMKHCSKKKIKEEHPPYIQDISVTEKGSVSRLQSYASRSEEASPPVVRRSRPSRLTLVSRIRAAETLRAYGSENLPEFDWNAHGLIAPLSQSLSDFHAFFLVLWREAQELLGESPQGRPYYPRTSEIREKFLKLATAAIEVATAGSEQSLLDIPLWIDSSTGLDSELAVLSSPQLCFERTFQLLPESYCFVRFLHNRCEENLSNEDKDSAEARFYTEGTPEYRLRVIYNAFCKRARWHLADINEREINPILQKRLVFSNEDHDRNFQDPNSQIPEYLKVCSLR